MNSTPPPTPAPGGPTPGPGPKPSGPTHPTPTRPPRAGHQPAGYFDAGRLAAIDHPPLTGEELTPSSAVAGPTATRESIEVLVALGAGASHRHEPDRPTAPGLPPRPIDYPRPVAMSTEGWPGPMLPSPVPDPPPPR